MVNPLPTAVEPILASDALSTAEVLETRASSLRRLATLLRLAPGAWALAVFESDAVQRQMVEDLRRAIAPLSLLEISLVQEAPDPLRIVQRFEAGPDGDTPVLSFTAVGHRLEELAGFLDIQRDRLAGYPHRLLFWVTEGERRELARRAPNFYSRLSGVFYFPGGLRAGTEKTVISAPVRTTAPAVTARGLGGRRRPYLPANDDRERRRLVDFLQRRIRELAALPRPNFTAIGDAWYDLAGVYETSLPRQWAEAEAAYVEAARAYARTGDTAAEADARYRAGDAAMRSYNHQAALEHLACALDLYRVLRQSPGDTPEAVRGEANVLQAQGDVLRFQAQWEEALGRYEAALALYRAVGDRLGEANVLQAQGDVLAFLDRREEALGRYEAALALYRAVGDRLGEANVLQAQGDVLAFLDRREEALAKYDQALALYDAVGDRLGKANTLKAQGDVLASLDRWEEALGRYEAALGLYRAVGDRLGEANVLQAQGDVLRFQAHGWQRR